MKTGKVHKNLRKHRILWSISIVFLFCVAHGNHKFMLMTSIVDMQAYICIYIFFFIFQIKKHYLVNEYVLLVVELPSQDIIIESVHPHSWRSHPRYFRLYPVHLEYLVTPQHSNGPTLCKKKIIFYAKVDYLRTNKRKLSVRLKFFWDLMKW